MVRESEGGGMQKEEGGEEKELRPQNPLLEHTGEDVRSLNDHMAHEIMEDVNEQEKYSDKLKKRLSLDLGTNATADYSRMNIIEIFSIFNFDADHAVTHWRLAKIMDGITLCNKEFRILKTGIAPAEIPHLIYNSFKENKQEKSEWDVVVQNPETGGEERLKASLADFAYLVDVLKINRELGPYKVPLRDLIYKYFKKEKITAEIQNLKGKKENLDLTDQEKNPRDDYDKIDINGYIAEIKKCQVGMQMIGGWRYQSEGHREMGGHADKAKVDGRTIWLPISGEMAQLLTLEDLQKNPTKENAGMMGQPQEIGDMDEAKTGALVRIRLAYLEQRRAGVDIRNLKFTQRLAKAMVGMTIHDNAFEYVDQVGQKKEIHLCGSNINNSTSEDGQSPIIRGMHAHYDKAMEEIRGSGLTNEEAADIAFTDVFLPCIYNNDNDWLAAIVKTFGVGKNIGSLVHQKDREFPDFVIKFWAKDWRQDGNPIRELKFENMKELREYVYWRIGEGDFGQGNPVLKKPLAKPRPGSKGEPGGGEPGGGEAVDASQYNEYSLQGEIKNDQAKALSSLVKLLLGDEYMEKYWPEFIEKGNDAAFLSTRTDEDKTRKVKYGEKKKGQKMIGLEKILMDEFMEAIIDEDKKFRIMELLTSIHPEIDPDQIESGEVSMDYVAEGIFSSLAQMSQEQRNKLK